MADKKKTRENKIIDCEKERWNEMTNLIQLANGEQFDAYCVVCFLIDWALKEAGSAIAA